MSTPSAHNLNLWGVLYESKRIINAHTRHFLALSVLFLLPYSFSRIIYPTLEAILSQPNSIFHRHEQLLFSPNSDTPKSPLLLRILQPLFGLYLYFCAVATITYSTIHGFYGRPVKVITTLKSLLLSFIYICSTFIVSNFLIGLVILAVMFCTGFIVIGFESMGFDVNFKSKIVLWSEAIVIIVLFMWFQVKWSLALVIAVAESKWGYEPLRRSAYLIKGMRDIGLWRMMVFFLVNSFNRWVFSKPVVNLSGWNSWAFLLKTVLSSSYTTFFLLYYISATAVLYMYCKALHGELAIEIVDEFDRKYVSLPDDDHEVPHVVSFVHG